jgi:hypothetical protein
MGPTSALESYHILWNRCLSVRMKVSSASPDAEEAGGRSSIDTDQLANNATLAESPIDIFL